MKRVVSHIVLFLVIPCFVCDGGEAGWDESRIRAEAAGINAFAFDLYRRCGIGEGNRVLSPFNIASAFSMAYSGSRGDTAMELKRVFRFSGIPDESMQAWEGLLSDLAKGGEGKGVELSVAHRLWINERFPVYRDFVKKIARHYGEKPERFRVRDGGDDTVRAVNRWAEKRTRGRIRDLLPPGAVRKDTASIITGAIYFSGRWRDTFDVDNTADAPFWVGRRESVTVPMMHRKVRAPYGETPAMQMLSLPYEGGRFSMVILLPRTRAGLAAIERGLTMAAWVRWMKSLEYAEVSLWLPRFTVEGTVPLGELLILMGARVSFTEEADFGAIAPELYLGAAYHRAFVSVHEKGSEAAAATAISHLKANGDTVHEFRADRPFLFFIRDGRTGALLFMGRLARPGEV
ncbi:MAG: serpin family protein [Spirochaetes bacterium]|nr:serpin family protein [Spirochaetota bacterium]